MNINVHEARLFRVDLPVRGFDALVRATCTTTTTNPRWSASCDPWRASLSLYDPEVAMATTVETARSPAAPCVIALCVRVASHFAPGRKTSETARTAIASARAALVALLLTVSTGVATTRRRGIPPGTPNFIDSSVDRRAPRGLARIFLCA